MPKFVIERQYLVPMYQHIVVESENLETACEMAVSDDIDWDTQEMDSDNARKTTLTNAKVIPDCLELVAGDIILRRDRPATPGFGVPGYGLSTFLLRERGRDRPAPGDPGAVHRRRIIRHALSAAVEGARGVGAVRQSRSCRERQQERTCVPRYGLRRSLSDERGSPSGEFNPCACSHQCGLFPCTQKRVGGRGLGSIPLLKGRSDEDHHFLHREESLNTQGWQLPPALPR